jgi:uncharacterized protein with HEPN domain
MHHNRDAQYIANMIFYAKQAQDLYYRTDPDTFLVDPLFQNAVSKSIEQIGEQLITGRLSDELRSAYPELPWNEIKGLRNIAVHEYGNIDWQSIAMVVTKDLPQLLEQLETISNDIETNPSL